jgi:5-methylcytosine-specific restriction endonuclease McrA
VDVECGCGAVFQISKARLWGNKANGRPNRCQICKDAFVFRGQTCEVPWRRCEPCGGWFVGKGTARLSVCSEDCLITYRGGSSPIYHRDCGECRLQFVAKTYDREFCSNTCSLREQRRQRRAKERAHGNRKKGRARRDAIVERFATREIAERDRWLCHLCGKKVPDRPYTAHDLDPTLDHLIPVSEGGDHTRANVALAHNRCNWERQTGGTVQLMLFG